MIRSALLLLMLTLAACSVGPRGVGSYRDADAQISSRATIDWARMQGDWVSVANFDQGDPWRTGSAVSIAWDAPQTGRLGWGGGSVPIAVSGPGRFAEPGVRQFWVLWVDEGYRTAVIGTPDGSFGFVLNRGAEIPADRLEAARQVLDFNGYDVAQLQVL